MTGATQQIVLDMKNIMSNLVFDAVIYRHDSLSNIGYAMLSDNNPHKYRLDAMIYSTWV